MIWFTWRQFRTPALVAAGGLAIAAAVLLLTGLSVAQMYRDSGLAACRSDCSALVDSFLTQAQSSSAGVIYKVAIMVMYVVPALIGLFWGAPLIARELEAGTQRLVWNQSVTRTRWLATKLAVVGLATMATVGLLSLAVSWGSRHIDQATMDRITPLPYGARGIVPVGYAAFALLLGVTAGMLIRRTVPAMVVTLVGYVAAVAAMPLWVRTHLMPARHRTPPLDLDAVYGLTLNYDGLRVYGTADTPGAWQLSNQTVTASGQPFLAPADTPECAASSPVERCFEWIGTQQLRLDVTYHPASHFWPLQWIETGIFVGVAVALAAFCLWWTRRRLT